MKKPPIKAFVISCLAGAVFTVAVLLAVSAYSKSVANSRQTAPDYVRYQSQGYDFDTVTNKHNLLFCVYDDDLVRCHLFSIDKDKNTLDILDLPSSTYISCDGFSGTLADGFEIDIFPNLTGGFLMLDIHSYVYISADNLVAACKLLGLSVPKETVIADDAYLAADSKQIKSYYSCLSKVLAKFDSIGSVDATAKLIGILVNDIKTDMSITQIIELVSAASKINSSDAKIHTLPGCTETVGEKKVYIPDGDRLAELLNGKFRVKGSSVPPSKLGLYSAKQAFEQHN